MHDKSKKEIKLFYCYARKDRNLREELEKRLRSLNHRYPLIHWSDREIAPGANWEQAVNENLDTADAILLLISPDFMVSNYCYSKEMQRALERQKEGTCYVIPILLRPTPSWEDAPFSKLQLLPSDAKPIASWPSRDKAFYDVVTGISRTIENLLTSPKTKEERVLKDDEQKKLRRNENETRVAGAVARIYVLGQFTLERHDGQRWQSVANASMQHQQVRSLLIYLISSPGRKLGREQAIEMLWPELDFETATNRLDKAVYNLRRLFEPGRSRPATSNLLLTEHATLMLADQSQLWVDADAFEALLSQARTSSDPGQTEQLLEEAMLLYGGDYLQEERDIPWIQARRESLQRNWIGLLLELADLRITREALSSAIDTLDRLLAVDPANEAAVQRLVILLAQSGRRAEALRIYQRFAAVLRQEYKIAPQPETRALYEAARRGEDPAAHAQAGASQGVSLLDSQAAEAQLAETHAYVQVGRNNQSPLVGREQELETLHRVLLATEQAKRMKLAGQKKAASLTIDTQRRPQCVILMGDVGIGKTRLAEETGLEAKKRGWAVAWTRAYAQESSIPYRMWVEIPAQGHDPGPVAAPGDRAAPADLPVAGRLAAGTAGPVAAGCAVPSSAARTGATAPVGGHARTARHHQRKHALIHRAG